eukprot:Tbor_TRINITY_DN4898_c0_g1::TRINITY_DN4898_c0_g1_i1::g.1245::m.1245
MTGITMELTKESNRSIIWLPSGLLSSQAIENSSGNRWHFRAWTNGGFYRRVAQGSCVPVSVANDWYKTLVIIFLFLFFTGLHANFHYYIHGAWWSSYCEWLKRNPEAFLHLRNTTAVSYFSKAIISQSSTSLTAVLKQQQYHPHLVMTLFALLMTACSISLLIMVVTSDPGLSQQSIETAQISGEAHNFHDIRIDESSSRSVIEDKECKTEERVACHPEGRSHSEVSLFSVQFCRHCRAFVSDFDHHCEVLGICIGRYNFGIFLMTLWFIGTSAIFYSFLNVYFMTLGSFFSSCPVSLALAFRGSFPSMKFTNRNDIQLFCYDVLSLFVPLLPITIPPLAKEAPPWNPNILYPLVISIVCGYLGSYALMIWAIYSHAAWNGRNSVVHRVAYDIKKDLMSGSLALTPQQKDILHHVYCVSGSVRGYHFRRDQEPLNSCWKLIKCMVLSVVSTRSALIVQIS